MTNTGSFFESRGYTRSAHFCVTRTCAGRMNGGPKKSTLFDDFVTPSMLFEGS